MNGIIVWQENKQSGEGEAVLLWADGTRETRPCEHPFTPSTDSTAIASLFGLEDSEHDREYIHVSKGT